MPLQSPNQESPPLKTLALTAVVASITLRGCAASQPPVNYANPGANYYADLQACSEQAARAQQAISANYGGRSSAPTGMDCTTLGNQTNCTSTGGGGQPDFLAAAAAGSALGRAWSEERSCMPDKGWQ